MAYFISKTGQKTMGDALEHTLHQFMFEAVTTAWSLLVLMDSPGILAPVVLTGRYRSNWALGIGSPVLTQPGTAGSPGAPSGLPVAPPALPALQLGQSVYLTNTLPYSGRIEAGHSPKAPSGVVGPVVADLVQRLGPIAQALHAGTPVP